MASCSKEEILTIKQAKLTINDVKRSGRTDDAVFTGTLSARIVKMLPPQRWTEIASKETKYYKKLILADEEAAIGFLCFDDSKLLQPDKCISLTGFKMSDGILKSTKLTKFGRNKDITVPEEVRAIDVWCVNQLTSRQINTLDHTATKRTRVSYCGTIQHVETVNKIRKLDGSSTTLTKLTISDGSGDVLANLWGDVALRFNGQNGDDVTIYNTLAEYNQYEKRITLKVNQLDSIKLEQKSMSDERVTIESIAENETIVDLITDDGTKYLINKDEFETQTGVSTDDIDLPFDALLQHLHLRIVNIQLSKP